MPISLLSSISRITDEAVKKILDEAKAKIGSTGRLVVRPSGTEPKIKIYYTTVGSSNEEAEALQVKVAEAFTKLVK